MFITSFGEQNITYKCCSNFLIHLCFYRYFLVHDQSEHLIKVCSDISLPICFLSVLHPVSNPHLFFKKVRPSMSR
ncbi:hypothetical protein C7Q29_15400 [Staphylococcus aureus]|nr:hypothetical protein C7Q29_15400 [Staphylococcus aureus]